MYNKSVLHFFNSLCIIVLILQFSAVFTEISNKILNDEEDVNFIAENIPAEYTNQVVGESVVTQVRSLNDKLESVYASSSTIQQKHYNMFDGRFEMMRAYKAAMMKRNRKIIDGISSSSSVEIGEQYSKIQQSLWNSNKYNVILQNEQDYPTEGVASIQDQENDIQFIRKNSISSMPSLLPSETFQSNDAQRIQDSKRNIHMFGPKLRSDFPVFSSVAREIIRGVSSPFHNRLGTQLEFTDICQGSYFFLALDVNGNLYINGVLTSNAESSYLTRVTNIDTKISQIACGPKHIFAIGNGRVYVAGENYNYAIGDQYIRYTDDLIPFNFPLNISKVSTSNKFSLLLTANGLELYSVGTGYHGNGEEISVTKKPVLVYNATAPILDIAVTDGSGFFIDNNHCLYMWGEHPSNYSTIYKYPIRVPLNNNGTQLPCIFERVSAGGLGIFMVHVVFVSHSGDIWGFGSVGPIFLQFFPIIISSIKLQMPIQIMRSNSLSIFIRDSKDSYFWEWCHVEGFQDFVNVFGYSQNFIKVPFKLINYDSFFSIGITMEGTLQALGRNIRKRAGLSETNLVIGNWTNIEVAYVPNEYKVSHLYFTLDPACEVALFGMLGRSLSFDLLSCQPKGTIDVRTSLGGNFLFYSPVNGGRFLLRYNSSSSVHTRLAESVLQVRDLDNSLEIGELHKADDQHSFYLDRRGDLRLLSFERLKKFPNDAVVNFSNLIPRSVRPIKALTHYKREIDFNSIHSVIISSHGGRHLSIIRTIALRCFFTSIDCKSSPKLNNQTFTFVQGPKAPNDEFFVQLASTPFDVYALTSEGKLFRYAVDSNLEYPFLEVPFDYSTVSGKIVSLQTSYDGSDPQVSEDLIVQRVSNAVFALTTNQQKAYFWGRAKNFVDPTCGLTTELCPNAVVNTSSINNNPEEFLWSPQKLLHDDIQVSGISLIDEGGFLFEDIKCGNYHRDDWRVCNGRGVCLSGNCVCYYGSGSASLPNLCQYIYRCGNYYPDDPGACTKRGKCILGEDGEGVCECPFIYGGSSCEGLSSWFYLLIILVFGILLCSILALCCAFLITLCLTVIIQKKRMQSQHIVKTLKRQLQAIDSVETVPPLVDLFMIDFSRISLQTCIAESADAVIWKANLKDVGVIAIKFFSPDFGNGTREEDAYNEGKILCGFDHPNIIQFHGFTIRQNSHIGIVMEYAEGGSLANHIRNTSQPSQDEIFRMLIDICTGMAVLHARDIIHRDIKPQNVLIQLKPKRSYKICDFGFAKKDNAMSTNQTNSVYGTSFYIAPEVFHREGYTSAADVYSFGIMLWEILCWNLNPYFRQMREENFSAFDITAQAANDPTFRPPIEQIITSGHTWAAEIFQSCVDHDPTRRPTFLTLRSLFKTRQREMASTKAMESSSVFSGMRSSSVGDQYYPLLDYSNTNY